jgi:TolB-like protein/DNA-binding winged helix-turn-helix (wHTH) protein/Flp pilus assembly protein TadD
MANQSATYRFGPYELRTRSHELYKHRTKLRLRPQSYQVLKLLVARAGDVVLREELHQLLWPAQTMVDFELGLNTCIKELRGILNDSASEPRYIETLPKVGYRFRDAVEVELPPASQELAVLKTAREEPVASRNKRLGGAWQVMARRPWPALLAIAVSLSVVIGVYLQLTRSRVKPQPTSGRLMMAVLPFENLTGDPAQEYFSDSLTEEMIAQLGRVDPEHLGVIARTSVMHYKHGAEQLEQIGRELGVQYVLEGSVRRDADKVRITAQLIRVQDQNHLWARQYDRKLSDLLSLQGEIAQEIAAGIQLTLGGRKRIDSAQQALLSPKAYEAYDLYLKGRYFWNKRTPQGFHRAVECFQQAIAKDPNYARAYAGLADSYALMSEYNLFRPNEIMPKARAAALRAVELDDRLAEAHTSLAVIAQNYDWDWQKVEKEYRRAIELDPNYATAHHWYAEYLALVGRFDEAFVEIERARQLDPLSLIIAADHGAILYFSRQYDRAIEQFRAVLDMEPNFPRAHILVFAYVQKGMYAEGLADVEKWRRIDDSPWSWMMLTYVCGRSGQQAKARAALKRLERLHRRWETLSLSMAVANIGVGDKENAIAWLQKAYGEHSISTALKVDPIYDPLRGDPRFQNLLQRMSFPQ